MQRIVIVGSGIVGLAHATAAIEKGWDVTVFERHSRPLGATVQNFGTIWPIGQPLGPKRERALASAKKWKRDESIGRIFLPAQRLTPRGL